MRLTDSHRLARNLLPALVAAAVCCTAGAQQADRERAQLMQMQQQVQRLQSDNTAAQREKSELQAKVSAAEQEQKKVGGDLTRARQSAAALKKDLEEAKGKNADLLKRVAELEAEISGLKSQTARQESALRTAADEKRRDDSAATLLAARLKLNTERADHCEVKHDGLQKLSTEVLERYERDRLGFCEPFTGLWRIRKENDIQQLRDRMYGFRLDATAPPAGAAPADTPSEPDKSAR